MIRYIYRRRSLRIAATLFDAIFGGLHRILRGKSPMGLGNVPHNPKIAFIRLDGIGDVLAALPAAVAIKAQFPEGTLTMLVQRPIAEILSGLPFIDDVLTTDLDLYASRSGPIKSIRLMLRLTRLLKALRPDIALDPRGDPRLIIAMWLSRIPVRIGARSAGAGFLLCDSVDYHRNVPEVEHNLRVAALLGAEAPSNPMRLIPDAKIAASLGERHPELTRPFFVVHPSASMPAKVWPGERFARVIDAIDSKYELYPVIVGARDAIESANAIMELSHAPALNLAGKTSLKELIALLSQARLFVGSDSGPAQMAAYTGIPTAIIFSGTNDDSVWRPPGENVEIISHSVDCSPCERRSCPNPRCLLGIDVDDVLKAISNLLTRTGFA